ncbi:uncharacterized protein LOC119270197 [Triticum dicoccoides]|uniref:uncharacterized protein LOC119270197 n=1 Tax=Triticum dicoccoides TaxID=85692 RepID=UPI000E7C9229|nr:uncharacterized protein LOC119270197 [Triticum dicoccoides]
MLARPGKMQDDFEAEREDLPGWGHWAMPQAPRPDMEMRPGEFMQLDDLMESIPEDRNPVLMENMPVEDANSNITLSLAPSHNSAPLAESANGPPAQPVLQVLDLNDINGPPLPVQPLDVNALEPLLEQAKMMSQPNLILTPDFNLEAIMKHSAVDPMQLEALTPIRQNSASPTIIKKCPDREKHVTMDVTTKNIILVPQATPNPPAPTKELNTTAISEAAADTPQEETYVILLGQEGADIWQKHFAPSKDSKEVIQVPIEWENHSSTPFGSIMGAKEGQSASSTSAIHGSRKRKGKTPLVETEVNIQEKRGMQQKDKGKKLKGASTVSAPTASRQAKSNTKST